MRLSEAILIGSTVVKPKAGTQFSAEEQAGCAIGMAGVAIGASFSSVPDGRREGGLESIYGWEWTGRRVHLPCWCFVFQKKSIAWTITHIFDTHVMLKKNWTLEQLVTWVRSVEPAEVVATDSQAPTTSAAHCGPGPSDSFASAKS